MADAARDPRETEAYRFDLSEELIAKVPPAERDSSRLLVLPAAGGLEERVFRDLPSYLRAGDVLVVNETRVLRARLRGRRIGGGTSELLLLRPADAPRFSPGAKRWLALARPGRRMREDTIVTFGDAGFAKVVGVLADGVREIELSVSGPVDEFLECYGEMPLPPYVGEGDEARDERYQTVFARVPGSVAAPTASLHFTAGLLETIRQRGVIVAPLVLDVGLGTFKPIETDSIDHHEMHGERYSIPEETAAAVTAAKREGRRVIAVGTTVVRALEGCAVENGAIVPVEGETIIYVTPGYHFRIVDALVTNFHLPGSTLLVLVSAFAGYERIVRAYRHAIEARFRFYSFGDAMFVEEKLR